jgi:hypothetical protein
MSERNRKLENSKYKEAKASPGFLFWKTFNSWQRLIRESLEPLGLTQVQYSILAATRLAATSYLESAEHVTQQNVYWCSLAFHSHRGFSPVIGRPCKIQAAVSTGFTQTTEENR